MPDPIRLVFLVLAATLMASGAQAASFNCARARSPDELAVCATLTLNDQDVRLAQLYDITQHLVAMGARGAIQDAQQEWLQTRRACGANRVCLQRVYTRRIGELNQVLQHVYSQGPF
jgi:uncharacterized protein